MFKKISLVLFLFVFILTLSSLAVFAQSEQEETAVSDAAAEVAAEELGVSEPGIFSWAKNLFWDAQALVASDPIKKAELKLKKANNQLLRARKLAKEDPNNAKLQAKLEDLNESYEKLTGDIDTRIEQFRAENQESQKLKDFMDKYIAQRLRHQEILEKLEKQVPEAVQEKIKEHREEQLEKFGGVMSKLQTNEELKERLQNAVGNVKDDVIRRANRLEIIERIEQKAAPAIKSEVQSKINEFKQEQSQVIQQLKNKAEEIKIEVREKAADIRQNVQERRREIKENLQKQKIDKEKPTETEEAIKTIQEENQGFFQKIKKQLRAKAPVDQEQSNAVESAE